MLAYLSRYTHRIAISNSRLIAFDGANVTFRWKDWGVCFKLMASETGNRLTLQL